ncbi:MAG: two-component system sensor histidine kinase NtrB [Burkholderiaceae bacterium]
MLPNSVPSTGNQQLRQQLWRFLLPILTIASLAITFWVTTYWSRQGELEENESKLIADALWARQNLAFQLESKGIALRNVLNAVHVRQGAMLRAGMEQFFRNAPEIEGVLLRQGMRSEWMSAMPGAPEALNDLLDITRDQRDPPESGGFPTYDGPRSINGKHYLLIRTYSVPLQAEAWALLNLQTFLDNELPWWFAEGHQVSLFDANGSHLLARVQKGGPGLGVYTHDMLLDEGSVTLSMNVNSRRPGPRLFSNAMAITVTILSTLLSLSLALLWRDFRRRLKIESKLREETAFRESMQDSMAVGLRVWDLDGRIRYVNPAFCRMVGRKAYELVGRRPPMPYWLASETDEYRRLVAMTFAGHAPRDGFETSFCHKDGRSIHVLIVEAPLVDSEGRQVGWMSSILDITDRKNSEELIRVQEEKLQTTSRLALIGEMASNIAHEVNQPLATMVSYAQSGINLTDRLQPDLQDLRSLFERLRDQAQRTGKIIKSVQNLVQERQPKREQLSTQALRASLLPTLDAMARPLQAEIDWPIGAGDFFLHADRIMLEQAVINLVKNALESFGENSSDRRVAVTAVLRGTVCEIAVQDNGSGLTDTDVEHIFKPFFSTKPEGLGLGLNLCRSVAEAHGGKLSCDEVPTGGMRFTMTFSVGDEPIG